MKSLIELIAACLVDDPEAVRVRVVPGPRSSRLHLTVAAGDTGRVIGREGRTAHAMRTLLSLGSRKSGRAYTLEIGP